MTLRRDCLKIWMVFSIIFHRKYGITRVLDWESKPVLILHLGYKLAM